LFTGLVEEVGRVVAMDGGPDGARLAIRAPLVREGLAIGDSVSVNGACLTAVALDGDGFAVDCAPETMRRTSLGALAPGDGVNLERALRVGDRLGGHMVQGHVDGTGEVLAARPEGESVVLEIGAPSAVLRYVVEKGSVAVDGVSLTIAARLPDRFAVALIPHTMAATTLGPEAVGRRVNLEADVVAKYVEALVRPLA
jgi:riboflavin synthase